MQALSEKASTTPDKATSPQRGPPSPSSNDDDGRSPTESRRSKKRKLKVDDSDLDAEYTPSRRSKRQRRIIHDSRPSSVATGKTLRYPKLPEIQNEEYPIVRTGMNRGDKLPSRARKVATPLFVSQEIAQIFEPPSQTPSDVSATQLLNEGIEYIKTIDRPDQGFPKPSKPQAEKTAQERHDSALDVLPMEGSHLGDLKGTTTMHMPHDQRLPGHSKSAAMPQAQPDSPSPPLESAQGNRADHNKSANTNSNTLQESARNQVSRHVCNSCRVKKLGCDGRKPCIHCRGRNGTFRG